MITGAMAVPTMWSGIQFRSRLEARWASFFSRLEWPWRYEPLTLQGPYIPDFLIGPDDDSVLVEVKACALCDDLHEHTDKVDASGWAGSAMVVGCWPWPHAANSEDQVTVGLGRVESDPESRWVPKVYHIKNWQALWSAAHNDVQWGGPC